MPIILADDAFAMPYQAIWNINAVLNLKEEAILSINNKMSSSTFPTSLIALYS